MTRPVFNALWERLRRAARECGRPIRGPRIYSRDNFRPVETRAARRDAEFFEPGYLRAERRGLALPKSRIPRPRSICVRPIS